METYEKLKLIKEKHRKLIKLQEIYNHITTSDLISIKFLKFKRNEDGYVDGYSSPNEHEFGIVNQEVVQVLAESYKKDIEKLSKELNELLK